MAFHCLTCGKVHDALPFMGAEMPDPVWHLPNNERDNRVELTADTCVLDGEHFFISGTIEIPLTDANGSFGFGVWVSQKSDNFLQYREHRNSKNIGPFFGWLSTHLSCYSEDTYLLKAMAHFRANDMRPYIEVEPTDHPLSIDQRHGVTEAKAWELVHLCEPQKTSILGRFRRWFGLK